MKKKILALLLAVCMLASVLAGCAGQKDEGDAVSPTPDQQTENVEQEKNRSRRLKRLPSVPWWIPAVLRSPCPPRWRRL